MTSNNKTYQQNLKRLHREKRRAAKHRTEIKIWMMRSGVTCGEVARAVKLTPAMVSHFLNRACRNQKIIDYMVSKGCPEKHFDDDNRVQAA